MYLNSQLHQMKIDKVNNFQKQKLKNNIVILDKTLIKQ